MSGAGADQAEQLRPFPAIDAEPPPRSRAGRVAVAGGAAAVAAALAAAGLVASYLVSSPGGGASPLPAVARSGSVLAMDPTGTIVASGPAGTPVHRLTGLGRFPLLPPPGLSPDGRFVTFQDGEIISLAGGRPRILRTRLSLGPRQILPTPAAMGDGDRAVVVLSEGRFANTTAAAQVSVVDLSTGATSALGTGFSAAADPRRPGAFVTVAAPPVATTRALRPGQADSRLELRDVGRAPVVLATAAGLNRDLGQDPATPVELYPLPDPRGGSVAVEVRDLYSGGPTSAGVVVLSRGGRAEATVVAALGPAGADLTWSPDGSKMAWLSSGPAGRAATVFSLAGATVTTPVPPGGIPDRCLWSPSGAALLCDTETVGAGTTFSWTAGGAGGGPAVTGRGAGLPLAWYGSGTA